MDMSGYDQYLKEDFFSQESLDRLIEIGGKVLVCKVIALFLQNVPERVQILRQQCGDGDLSSLERTAHSIKSSAANLGLMQLRFLSQQLELSASQNQSDDCKQWIERLENVFQKSLTLLKEKQNFLECE